MRYQPGRQISKTTWLLVHDADEIDGWTAQGFRTIDPPPDVSADAAVQVLRAGLLSWFSVLAMTR